LICPSTILSTIFSGLPSASAFSRRIRRSLSTCEVSASSRLTTCGFIAAICIAMSAQNA
jgi:hypothetical protein